MNNKRIKYNKNTKQQGVALIGVLIIVALITAAYTFLISKQTVIFDNTRLNIEQSRVFNYFYSTSDLAKSKLLERLTGDKKAYISRVKEDGELDKWAFELSFATEEIGFKGKLIDRSSKLNINQIFLIQSNYANIDAGTNFNSCLINLLNNLGEDDISGPIIDYINQQKVKKYFLHIDELNKVEGITNKAYQKIKKYLYADGRRDIKININTASKDILRCIHTDIDGIAAKNIIESRPIKNTTELKNILYNNIASMTAQDIDKQILPMLDIKSSSFEMQSEISTGDSVFEIKSILHYTGGKIKNHYRTFYYKL